jgi:hypothetical protein
VRRVLVDPIAHGFSPSPMAQQAYFDPPAFAMEAEVAPMVPDAPSARNEVRVAVAVGDASGSHDVVAEPPQEIHLTQNHPSKCLFHIVSLAVTPSGHLYDLIISLYFSLCCRRHF